MERTIDTQKTRIGVVGAGAWGTALAKLLADKGFRLDLWVFETEVREQIEKDRENKVFLPNIRLPENIIPTNDLEIAVKDKDLVLVVVPSHCMRDTATRMKPFISPDTVVVTASKGIENQTHMIMTQILEEILDFLPKENIAVLSGPSFAKEVANRVPTVVAAASIQRETAVYVQKIFSCPTFRVYVNDDPIGTQIGGAVKNVIAIASGIIDGMNLGLNTRAALITRGLAEISRLGVKMGARPLTFSGLAGLGDLVLTCTGDLSRNRTVGLKLGQGKSLAAILGEMNMVAEGIKTTRSAWNLARKQGVDMPILEQIHAVLYDGKPCEAAVKDLLTRDLKEELG